jgi:hypothetical protein
MVQTKKTHQYTHKNKHTFGRRVVCIVSSHVVVVYKCTNLHTRHAVSVCLSVCVPLFFECASLSLCAGQCGP